MRYDITEIVDNGDGTSDITLDCDYQILDTDVLECDETMECDMVFPCMPNADKDKIIFRNRDGSVSDILDIISVEDINKIKVQNVPAWVQVYPDSDNSAFTIGTSEDIAKDYLVMKITPSDEKIQIEAINYDVRSYNA